MKTRTLIYTILAIAALAGIFAMGVYASPLKGKTGESKARRFTGDRLAKAGQMLGITDEQKSEIASVVEKYRPEFKEKIQSFMEAQRNLKDDVTADKFNESAIRTASDKVGEYRTDLAILIGKAYQDIKTILTPEQLDTIKKFKEMRQSHLEDYMNFINELPGNS